MTIALVLERAGALREQGLDCRRCRKGSPGTRDYRGCGVPPRLRTLDRDTGEPARWRPRAYVRQCEADGLDVLPDEIARTYSLAGLGGIYDLTGELWAWCPRWWLEYHRGPERSIARLACDLAWAAEAQATHLVWDGAPLTPALAEQVELAMGVRGWLKRQEIEQMREDAAADSPRGATSARSGGRRRRRR